MSKLTEFYTGDGVDTEGRTFKEILAWSDEKLEIGHDYIQWLFPKVEPSNFNPDAPIPTLEEIDALKNDSLMKNRMRLALGRFAQFLGLRFDSEYGQVFLLHPGTFKDGNPVVGEKYHNLWTVPNHNWFRITRVLMSLRTFGLEEEAENLFEMLNDLREAGYASENSFGYWKKAME